MNIIKERKSLVIYTIFTLFRNITDVLSPILLMMIINYVVDGNKEGFIKSALFSGALSVLSSVLDIFIIRYETTFTKLNMICLKKDLYNAIFDYPYYWFNKRENNEYISFFMKDLDTIENYYYNAVTKLISVISLLILSAIMVVYINPIFLLLYPFALAVSFISPQVYSKRLPKYNMAVMNMNQKMTKVMEEQLRGFGTIKSYQLGKDVERERNEKISNLEESKSVFYKNISYSNALLGIVISFIWVVIYFSGGIFILKGTITVGAFAAIIKMIPNILNPCIQFPQYINHIKSTKPIRDKCNDYYNYPKNQNNLSNKKSLTDGISIENVSFGYDDTNHILKNISFTFEKGKKYAIIGENGSGKSTLIKLIAGYYNNYIGKIMLDDVEEKEMSESDLFSIITYMSQDVFLFDKTVEENIVMNKPYDKDKYNKVVNELRITEICKKIKDQNTIYDMSGGESQKIALARAILRDSDVILADEPTASLDQIATIEFEDIIVNLKNNLCIVITHNIDKTLSKYDSILVMKNGQLEETGTYDQLIDAKGYFYEKLYHKA